MTTYKGYAPATQVTVQTAFRWIPSASSTDREVGSVKEKQLLQEKKIKKEAGEATRRCKQYTVPLKRLAWLPLWQQFYPNCKTFSQ